MMVSRRAILTFAAAAAVGCSRAAGEPGVLRVGYMANLTHAPILAGMFSGRIAKALGLKIEERVFRAGPRVTEALLGGAIDIGVAGPAPLVSTHSRHPSAYQIVSGCTSGGASFVVAKGVTDLHKTSLASPQIGSTPDVALRKYLAGKGLVTKDKGGDVTVHALANPDILVQMKRGELQGAWVPEPWATRLVKELGATRLVDERDLWKDRTFPTALVAARTSFVAARNADVQRFVAAVAGEVKQDRKQIEEEAYTQLKKLVKNPGARPVLHEAMAFLDFGTDPLKDAVETFAKDAYALGLIPQTSLSRFFA